jgi:hypothetical protein
MLFNEIPRFVSNSFCQKLQTGLISNTA